MHIRRFCVLAILIQCQMCSRAFAAPPPNRVASVPIGDVSREFARHLAVEADTVVVGSKDSVLVCKRDPADGIWVTTQTIEIAGEVLSVDLGGSWIAIGIQHQGYRVELHQESEEGWVLHQKITVPDEAQCEFGRSVAISDEWCAIGAPETWAAEQNSGGVYLYTLETGRWRHAHTLRNAVPDLGILFGANIKISDALLAISMLDKQELSIRNLYAGVCIYSLDEGQWSFADYLEPTRPEFLVPLVEPRTFAVSERWAALGGLSAEGGGVVFLLDRVEERWRVASRVQEPAPSHNSLGYMLDGNSYIFVAAVWSDLHHQDLHMYQRTEDGWALIGSIENLRMDERSNPTIAVSEERIVATGVIPWGDEVHSAVLEWPLPTTAFTSPDDIDSMSQEQVFRFLAVVAEQRIEWEDAPRIVNRLTERYDRAIRRLNELSDDGSNSYQPRPLPN